MSIERRSEVIPALGRVEVARGNFFLLLTATGTVNLRLNRNGTSEGFDGVTGGILVKRIESWDDLFIEGAAGITVTYFVGFEFADVDESDIRLQIAALAGVAQVSEEAAATIVDSPDVNAADAAQTLLFAANAARKRITVFCDSANAGSCFARTIGGANNIAELVAGVSYEFKNKAGLDVRNDTGAVANFYIFEEA